MNEKKIVALGVTGSIAAFKAAELTGRLVREGFDVHVIMTASAQELIGEKTFLTLSRNPVTTSLWRIDQWRPGHIELALKARVLVIAPATANIIGKIANGIADDALSTYALSHTGRLIIAPAMNARMWRNPAVRDNCSKLEARGAIFVGPERGRLACAEEDEGRMADIEKITAEIKKGYFSIIRGNQ